MYVLCSPDKVIEGAVLWSVDWKQCWKQREVILRLCASTYRSLPLSLFRSFGQYEQE